MDIKSMTDKQLKLMIMEAKIKIIHLENHIKQGKQFNDADGFAFLMAMTEDLLVEQRKELQVYQDELDSRGSVW